MSLIMRLHRVLSVRTSDFLDCSSRLYVHLEAKQTIDMPIVSPQAVASVASRVLALSPETNPYSWLQHTLRDEFVPQLSSKPYQILLWVAVGLHSIAMLCHMATLYFRARSKALWLFHRNPAGHIVSVVA